MTDLSSVAFYKSRLLPNIWYVVPSPLLSPTLLLAGNRQSTSMALGDGSIYCTNG